MEGVEVARRHFFGSLLAPHRYGQSSGNGPQVACAEMTVVAKTGRLAATLHQEMPPPASPESDGVKSRL